MNRVGNGDVGGADPGGVVVETPVLSVVIPYFNAADTLGQQLEALAAQIAAPPFEVVVVDNMSPEPPTDVIEAWSDRLDIRAVQATEAQGVSCARNVGIREARSDAIVFVDSDDVAGPTFLAAAAAALQQADVVTGSVQSVDAAEFEHGVAHVRSFLSPVDSVGSVTELPSRSYPILMGGACAMTRSAALRLDGFDQRFVPGAEDNDLAVRAVRGGERIVAAPGMTLAERRRSTTSGAFRRSYEAGAMHMALCAVHDLWTDSPHLHNPSWWKDGLKLPLAFLRVLLRGKEGAAERLAFAGRAGLRLGQAQGFWRYRVLRRRVVPQRGIGLYRTTSQ